MSFADDLALALQELRAGRAVRGYFINTLFDSTFVNLGIIAGTAFVPASTSQFILKTMFTASLFIGISTGISVFEAETVESEIRVARISRAMLRTLEDTAVERSAKMARFTVAFVNFLAPLMVVGAASLPFLLLRDLTTAAYTAVGIALVVIFIVGAVLGYQSKRNPILKGVRLAGVGLAAYLGITLLEHVL